MPNSINARATGYFWLFILSCSWAATSFSFDKNRPLQAATLIYPPYQYLENGEPKGIAVEIIREAVKRTGVKQVNFKFYPWNRAVYSTQFGQSDILFNAGKNEARQLWGQYIDSTLILQKYLLFKRRDVAIQVNPNFSNVNNRSIAIRLGYLYGTGPFRQALDGNKFSEVVHSNSTQHSVDLLLGGRVDFFVGDRLPVMHYLKEHKLHDKIDVIKETDNPAHNMQVLEWPTYILFSKKTIASEYVNEVNAAMESMRKDGFIQDVIKKYGN